MQIDPRTVFRVLTEVQPRLLAWWDGRLRSLAFDLVVAIGTILAHLYSYGGRLPDTSFLELTCLVATFLALVVRRRFPLATALVVALANVFASTLLGVLEIALYTVASRRGVRLPTWVAVGAVLLSVLLDRQLFNEFTLENVFTVGVVIALEIVLSVLLGLWVLQRRTLLAGYRERAEQIEREQELLAERAVITERRRIAREMHDVVAHRVGIVSLHAGALAMNPPDETSGELAETIRGTSTTAMSELRDMLRVLRDDDAESEPTSAPTLAGIADLVGDAVRSGANIRLIMPDPVPVVSAAAGRAAYRVAQEALTNAAKHAPHAAVHVSVAADDDVTVTVTNRCGPTGNAAPLPSSGFGLVGMRERVALAGGKVDIGPTDDGGYRVHAVLPRCVPAEQELEEQRESR